MPHSRSLTIPRILLFLQPVIILSLITAMTLSAQVSFTSSNLPVIVIDTRGQEIPPESPRIRCDMGIIWNGPGKRNEITDPFNNYDGLISIKIHGSSSSVWPKKSYAIETEKPDSSNHNVSLLGMPKENDWVLYAPYYDRSLMRNVFTYRMFESWGHYAPRTRYCELILNGDYQGIYVLTEKIKRDKNRVNIKMMDADDNAGDSLTGGYIFKLDKEVGKPNFPGKYKTTPAAPFRMHYQYVYPQPDRITDSQKNYIKHYFWHFEDVVQGDHADDTVTGYPACLNVSSFVDYFLISEFARNVDSYSYSCYFHKDRDSEGGKIAMGPVWDYNFSFGNVSYNDADKYSGWNLFYMLDYNDFHPADPHPVPLWWDHLIQDSMFVEQVIARWHELRQSLLTPKGIFAFIDAIADTLDEAQERNFTLWIKPGHEFSYTKEVDKLKSWSLNRIRWIDNHIVDLNNIIGTAEEPEQNVFLLLQNSPNPFTDETRFTYRIPDQYHVQLNIWSLTGQLLESIVDETQPRGRYEVVWQPHGQPAGIYIMELRAGPHRAVKKLSIIR